jgi:hypothetical protein
MSTWTISKKLMAIAEGQGDICRLTKRLIGKTELALLLANAALKDTSIKLSQCSQHFACVQSYPRAANTRIFLSPNCTNFA